MSAIGAADPWLTFSHSLRILGNFLQLRSEKDDFKEPQASINCAAPEATNNNHYRSDQ
jgi:hypothetical protein